MAITRPTTVASTMPQAIQPTCANKMAQVMEVPRTVALQMYLDSPAATWVAAPPTNSNNQCSIRKGNDILNAATWVVIINSTRMGTPRDMEASTTMPECHSNNSSTINKGNNSSTTDHILNSSKLRKE